MSDSDSKINDRQAAAVTPAARKPSRIINTAKRHGKTAAVSVFSLFLGFAGTSFLQSPSDDAEQHIAGAPDQPPIPVYVAAVTHRHEPIAPLVPFEGLATGVVKIGKRLFHDPGLSGNGRVSCATCHNVSQGGDDGLPLSVGMEGHTSRLNAPTVLNAALNFVQFWDGRAKTLEQQIDDPITNPAEMASDWQRIVTYLNNDPSYTRAFHKHLGGEPTEERVRSAIATFERSLITVDSKFDQWLEGNESALTADELSGYYSFQKLNCVSCHQGANVGGSMFQPLGTKRDFYTESRKATEADLGRFNVTGEERDRHVFRVPSLRNIDQTAPYFHDGSISTLEKAVESMMVYQVGVQPNPEEVRRISIFLKTLTGVVRD